MRHNVVIFSHGQVQLVAPPLLPAQAGDDITFHATGQAVTLLFPPGTPLDYPPDASGWIIIRVEPGHPVTVRVLAPRLGFGRYPYAVWCDSDDLRYRTFAKGNSDPEIIIYG